MDNIKVENEEDLQSLGIENEMAEEESGVKFKLDKFEGPLDLLLHLIKDAKIDIKDIFISTITEQFLEYINEFSEMPVEKVGDFIEMAATLLEIKSKKLLPPPPKESDEDEEDPEKKLIRQLEEYKIFKEQSEILSSLENVNSLYKEPEPLANGYRYELKDFSFDKLLDAFALIMHKVEQRAEVPEAKQITKDRFTVAQKMADIKDKLLQTDKIMFSELYQDDYSKSEVINTFLALLELLKTQIIRVVQPDLYSDIFIEKNEELI
ncbi:MAG: segregation/condensation protein A [Clostridia bacterium]|nr:segregation/condensation protein A [Clostridia bacterium]